MSALAARVDLRPGVTPAALPYGFHSIDDQDVAAVAEALSSGLLAQGPRVAAFEAAVGARVGAQHSVACSSGTAALHLALSALGVGPGDRCIVPTVTFLATATSVRLCGADVTFCDVDPETGLMTANALSEALDRTSGSVKAVLPVHLGGRTCGMPAISAIAASAGAAVLEDACHAFGTASAQSGVIGAGDHSSAAVFSFHPVKNIACGEGGMVCTRDVALADRMRRLRNHGVTREPEAWLDHELSSTDGQPNPWAYEQQELGFNYRMTDIEAALGLSQLRKLEAFKRARRQLTDRYLTLLAPLAPIVSPIRWAADEDPFLHLFGVLIDFATIGRSRADVCRGLARRGVGTQVHYIPVHRQPYFRRLYGDLHLPGADAYYARCLTLPLFPAMTQEDCQRVCLALAAELGT